MPPKGKAKAAPPPAAAPVLSVEDLFSSLQRHIQAFEYEKSAKVADQVLAVAPGDEDALRCKIVALIKADAVDRALSSIENDVPKGSLVDLRGYKVYCLYRKNKLQEALELIETMEKNPTIIQLESQILYRLGKMEACVESYKNLQKFKIDSLDLKTNTIAALISAGRASEVQPTMDALKVKPSNSFEMAYNYACSLIEKKQYSEAEQMLLSARRIGQETLMEDDLLDDEIESELAPIAVQLAYVYQMQGRTTEALEVYSDIVKKKIADASSIAVATNNLIALKGGKEASDWLKRLEQIVKRDEKKRGFTLADGLEFKLFSRQRESLFSNMVLLLLHANKLDQAQEIVSWGSTSFRQSISWLLLQAAIFVKDKNIQKAEDLLGSAAEPVALLTRAQIATTAGHFKVAAESLTQIKDIEKQPATVATVVSLREKAGDLGGEEAARLYEELYLSGRGGPEALAALVKASAALDLSKAESYAERLKPLGSVDVEALEKETPSAGKMVVEEELAKKKTKRMKKRKRKPRYPKGFDPENPGPKPDPERWLPRRERSSYRPKKRDKRHLVRGAQGAVAPVGKEPVQAVSVAAPKSEPAKASGKSRRKGRS